MGGAEELPEKGCEGKPAQPVGSHLGPVGSQLKACVLQEGFTGLQGGVHGGARLEPQWSSLLGWRNPYLGS